MTAFTQRVNDFDNEYPQFRNVGRDCVCSYFAEVVSSALEVTGGCGRCGPEGSFEPDFTAVKVADVALCCGGGQMRLTW